MNKNDHKLYDAYYSIKERHLIAGALSPEYFADQLVKMSGLVDLSDKAMARQFGFYLTDLLDSVINREIECAADDSTLVFRWATMIGRTTHELDQVINLIDQK